VPLEYAYSELPLAKTLESLVADGKAPVYVVHFTQLEAAQSAQDFTSINVCTREGKSHSQMRAGRVQIQQPVRSGHQEMAQARHRAASRRLLPKYRVLVEQLAQKGLLQSHLRNRHPGRRHQCAHSHRALYALVQIRRAENRPFLSARDFHQIGGRAGRKGFDDRGWVVAQAPEHAIENLKLAEKAARDGKKTGQAPAAGKEFRQLGQKHLRAADRRAAGAVDLAFPGFARDAAERV
jgi:superfamily II RNA helicase